MNLERITSALEALVESGTDVTDIRQALQTIASVASEMTHRG